MQFSSLILSATALVLGTASAATVPRQDPHITDFRTYGVPGCFNENEGVWTITQSGTNICEAFSTGTLGEPVESIFAGDIADGWSLYAYTDANCTDGQFTVPVGIDNCYDYPAGLGSFIVVNF